MENRPSPRRQHDRLRFPFQGVRSLYSYDIRVRRDRRVYIRVCLIIEDTWRLQPREPDNTMSFI